MQRSVSQPAKLTAAMPDAAAAKPVRAWSLRAIFLSSLLFFCVVPAALVGWVLYRSNLDAVDALSDKIVRDVARQIQLDTEAHMAQAHIIFNGLIQQQPSDAEVVRARQMLQKPELFEQNAFAMTRMTPNVPYIYLGTAQGEFLGVEALSQGASSVMRVGVRAAGDEGRRYFSAHTPGDRSQALPTEGKNYEPRGRPWYQAAMESKGRVFTSVYPSASKKQLLITLSQPVYGADGSPLGVFAIDLFLKRLSESLQAMVISPKGSAFLVDEQGFLVASSAGDVLFDEVQGKLNRVKPDQSKNQTIRAAYAQTAPSLGKTLDASVQRVEFSRRVGDGDDALIVNLQPFGDNLGLRWSLVVAAPESDFAAQTQAALKKTVLVMLLTLAAGAALATWLAYGLTRRFRGLARAAEQLGHGEVPESQRDTRIREVNRLSAVMRSSAQEIVRNRAAIEAHAVALQDANEHLEDRVRRRTAELEASREEALSAALAKSSFLATMSHEIRTPLNGVVGMTTLLADTPLNAEQRDYVHTMRISSDQLLGVINDILDFSKIESGRLDLESEPLNVQATIEEACDIAAARAREKGLELLADMGDQVPTWVRGDVTRLRQVLLNFINNAIKFTEHGQIVVSANLLQDFAPNQGALLEFRVKDTGIGVPLDRQSALFQSFTQVDASTTRKYGGTGLGLAICKRLAEIMGGHVGVESAPGEGSTFWFTARLAYADAPDQSASSIFHMASLNGKRAAVVDDTVLNLRILDKQLKRWGMQPVLFERAQPALDWLAKNPVDVVVTDMHMPDMDGQSFAQAIRRQTPDAHIVLLTSGTMPTGEAAKVFDARLLKPYRQSQLFDALTRIAALHSTVKTAPTEQVIAAKNQRILVADDNAVNLKVALAMLAKLGYEAATALNGREAADLVAQSLREQGTPFAAVLMDANMPVMDGFEATRLILSMYGASAPRIVALTASVLEEDRQRCLDAGMQGFLPKPLRIDELSEALARYAIVPRRAPKIVAARAIPEGAAGLDAIETQVVLMDWSRLEQFKEFDDDERSMTREVITLFTADAPQRAEDILRAYQAADSAALSRAAHALKGAASNVGARALTDACFALEQSCQQGLWPKDADSQVALIAELSYKTIDALKNWAL
jgi:signal transduction histidine kinase/CheY-like chemotaxis protein/HPt (histidine-containing phosphotransfer) domain-containing protein